MKFYLIYIKLLKSEIEFMNEFSILFMLINLIIFSCFCFVGFVVYHIWLGFYVDDKYFLLSFRVF